MSWLFVACIPGLLMLATFGLERIEASLTRGAVSAADVDKFLQDAGVPTNPVPQRESSPLLPPDGQPRTDVFAAAALPADLTAYHQIPYIPYRPNPGFQPTRHADPV